MKQFFIILFLISCVSIFANPIAPHINITEFIFTETGWQMELYSDYLETNCLDSCQVVCSEGSSYFQPGIEYYEGTLLVVTEEDLVTPLFINEQTDSVSILYSLGDGSSFNFGTLNSMVLAPSAGQSLRAVGLSLNAADTYYVFAKDNTPSMGTWDDGIGFRGIFCGYVFDSLMNPVENVEIEHTPDCISIPDINTDENGYFEVELYAFNYNCDIHLGALASMDSIISIEPDAQNYYEFVFENYVHSDDYEIELPSSFYKLFNFPNPFNPNTEISFQISDFSDQNLEIQIFNSKGQKINVIDTFPNGSLGTRVVVEWDGTNSSGKTCPSGVYLYKLVSGDKELAANKMLLLK
ncbi:MAG: T9SS type A sorting domain-containing protein [Candidatus Cloacimonadales bacterium]|nr:T9SS type A sorting domain-containing protein [Candidatus Cloacimonadales bacterium]